MKKLLNKKGFTLMEMLIVVAIIVILVAISIPAFSDSLNSAKEAADAANFRSAKAAALVAVQLGTAPFDDDYYDIAAGEFKTPSGSGIDAANYGQCANHKKNGSAGGYIKFDADTETVVWSNGAACGH